MVSIDYVDVLVAACAEMIDNTINGRVLINHKLPWIVSKINVIKVVPESKI